MTRPASVRTENDRPVAFCRPRWSSRAEPSASTTRTLRTYGLVDPYMKDRAPEALLATIPPMAMVGSDGSGVNRYGPAALNASRAASDSPDQPAVSNSLVAVTRHICSRMSTPGWSARRNASCSGSWRRPRILPILFRFSTCPPSGTAPPERPVRMPCTVTGVFALCSWASCSEISCSLRGKEIESIQPARRDSSWKHQGR
ncbi:hypothetical protein LCGC14_2317370 [marine sediment metagenome]|uniref:Uncharacterized protein n=1 Tax=marine sediment metagenome TaxID=412755 RepID=A0A0F9D6E5_9ZZZZ